MLLNLAILLVLGAQEPAPAANPGLPAEIRDYYRDYNFVNAFSRPFERQALAARRLAPQDLLDPRLRAVRDRMARLADRRVEVDPGMVLNVPRQLVMRLMRSDLFEIRSQKVDVDAGVAWIELEALALTPQATGQLVADFPRLGLKPDLPSAAELVEKVSGTLTSSREIHRWVRVGGEWMLEGPTRVFVQR